MLTLTIPEMLDAANNEIQAAKGEICGPVDNRLIDALEMLHAVITHHIFSGPTQDPERGEK